MSELGRIFFQNSNLTVNLTPALIVLAVLLLGEIDEAFTSFSIYNIYHILYITFSVFIYPGLDALLWFYFKFYGR